MKLLRYSPWGMAAGLMLIVGCTPAPPAAPKASATQASAEAASAQTKGNGTEATVPAEAADTAAVDPTDSPAEDATTAPAEDGAPATEPSTDDGPQPANAPTADDGAATDDASAANEVSSHRVLLGSPELTAGIPGEGPLTEEQIQAWLDDEKNHAVLEVELPMGLAAGASQLKGLDANPLTRAKIELGRQLYFDTRLSADGTISCSSCHHPDEGFGKHTQFGVGIRGQMGGRNSPISYNRILSDIQFWDGRAATLEEQAKGPIANPIEMGYTHEECVDALSKIPGYAKQFEKIFGELTIDAVAQAIASFERAIVTSPSPFDYHEQLVPYAKLDLEQLKEDDPDAYVQYEAAKAAAEEHPMSESTIRGRVLFFSEKASCSACHVGANLTDEKYHNIGVGMDAEKPDLGRYEITKEEKDRGAFKTPTIRNVALSAPYMHDGSQKTLEEVVDFYAKGGHPNEHLDPKIKKLELTDQDKKDLVEFMKACTGEFPKIETGRLPE